MEVRIFFWAPYYEGPLYTFHLYDLPEDFHLTSAVAIDTETMGLRPYRDRLCLVQLCDEAGACHLVHFPKPIYTQSPNLVKMLCRKDIQKIFHYARFDVMTLTRTFDLPLMENIYCTKIASRLTRTYSDRHGLKDLCKELLSIELSKDEQASDWGSEILTEKQCGYAVRDVLYLHQLRDILTSRLMREQRYDLAQACFQFLPYRTALDLLTDESFDIFAHSEKR